MRLTEAFKALDALNEDTFTMSDDGIKKLAEFEENDDLVDELSVIDLDAETEDDFEESYVGKVILDCCVCHSKLYKDKEDVVIDEESQLANVGEDCPYCYTPDGFKVIGEVAAFNNNSESQDPEEVNPEEANSDSDDAVDVTVTAESDDDTDDLEEGLFSKKKPQQKTTSARKISKWEVFDCWNKYPVGEYDTKDEAEKAAASRGDDGRYKVQMVQLEEGLFSKKDKGTVKEIKASEIKRGNTLIDDGEEEKVIKVEDEGTHVDVSFKHGNSLIPKNETVKIKESVNESVNNVNVETDEDIINISTDDNGKVIVSTEPTNSSEEMPEDAEMIVPVSDETEAELTAEPDREETNEEEINPEETDAEEVDVEIDDFDEDSFNELGEQYFREAYSNVETFRTVNVSETEEGLLVEGVIKFTSGNDKKTSFLFESQSIDTNKNVRFLGENRELNTGKGSFIVTGNINENKLVMESLDYNYTSKDLEGNMTTLSGNVKRG